jgi:hypothetical protein
MVFAKTYFTFLPSRAANRQIHSEYFNHCLTKQKRGATVDILTDLTCSFLYSIETNLDNYQVILVKLYSFGILQPLSNKANRNKQENCSRGARGVD